jgi:hypothetical protein
MKMEPTEVSETSTLSIHTPANYPKEEIIRYSKHDESLKTSFNSSVTPAGSYLCEN